MFDRCDANTSRVVDLGLEAARAFGHNYLGTEHLLLAMAERRDLLPAPVQSLLPEVEAIRARIASLIGGPAQRDADLLATVGVDLDEVRSAVRRTFGDETIDRLGRRRVHQPWQPWRRPSRRCTSLLAGTMAVACRAKQAFERAGRDADRRRLRSIDPAALLLGMVEVEDAMANRLLRDGGIDPDEIRSILAGGKA